MVEPLIERPRGPFRGLVARRAARALLVTLVLLAVGGGAMYAVDGPRREADTIRACLRAYQDIDLYERHPCYPPDW